MDVLSVEPYFVANVVGWRFDSRFVGLKFVTFTGCFEVGSKLLLKKLEVGKIIGGRSGWGKMDWIEGWISAEDCLERGLSGQGVSGVVVGEFG